MAGYIDGFALPIPRDRLGAYKRLADRVAEVWKEHGALEYWEFVGDDLKLEGTRSFIDAVDVQEDEAIVFGWVAFDSRDARDEINKKVATDPRMAELMGAEDTGFDPGRMVYGGFSPLVR